VGFIFLSLIIVSVVSQHTCSNFMCNSELRLANACLSCNGVDGWTNNIGPSWGNIGFRFISIYAALAPNPYKITVYPAGQESPVLVSFELTMQNNTQKTIALTGTIEEPDYIVIEDCPWDTEIPSTKFELRFVNLSPDSDTLSLQIDGGATLFNDVPYGVAGDYITMPPSQITLNMLNSTGDVVLTMPSYPFIGAHVFTVYAMGLVNGKSIEVLQGIVAEDK
jgi:hypothetical protein